MLNWDLLSQFGITALSANGGPTPASIEQLLPKTRLPEYSAPDDWLATIAIAENGGDFLGFVDEFVGDKHGAVNAVQFCACWSPSKTATFHKWLASTGLKFLVMVDPHVPQEFNNTESVVDGMRVLLVAADPLEFLSQIDAGPSVLFNEFYADETFPDDDSSHAYYRGLSTEILRVLAFRNIVRGASLEDGGPVVLTPFGPAALLFSSGEPLAVGYCGGIFQCLAPQDESPETWPADVGCVVTDVESIVLGFAFLRKR